MHKKQLAALIHQLRLLRPYDSPQQCRANRRAGQGAPIYWLTISWENHIHGVARGLYGDTFNPDASAFLDACGYAFDLSEQVSA